MPFNEDMTRRGRTEIVSSGPPEWRPTPSMIERNPNDIRKIGRQSSSGCIGMFNEHVVEVFERAKMGTQVTVV